MSLNDLTKTSTSSTKEGAIKTKRSLTWLLPAGLLAGFALVFYLLFGERLQSSVPVKAAPVVTIRSQSKNIETPNTKPDNASPRKTTKGQLLFQASGWVEPDPYTTYVSTLVDGVVSKVHALEGQVVTRVNLIVKH